MQIILINIPMNTTASELLRFVAANESTFGKLLKRRRPNIRAVELLDLLDDENNCVETHGVVAFDSNKAAQRAIQILHGKLFRGRAVEVRQFVHRAPSDKRVRMTPDGPTRHRCQRRQSLQQSKRKIAPMPAPVSGSWIRWLSARANAA